MPGEGSDAMRRGRTTTFPPPLWGRDREGGTPQTPDPEKRTVFPSTVCSEKPRVATDSEQMAYPPPHPSPTRGEGADCVRGDAAVCKTKLCDQN
jgi:hypothetical protein